MRGIGSLTNGAVSQDAMCKYDWVQDLTCLSAEAKKKSQLRLQLEHEVRLMEQFAKGHCWCWLLERGTVSCPGACQTQRVINHEQACRSQFCWRSEDSQQWNSNFRICKGRIASDGSCRWNVNKYAACGWAVVQMDLDGGHDPVVWRWRIYVDFVGSAKDHQKGGHLGLFCRLV